jgi:hypothetical protein
MNERINQLPEAPASLNFFAITSKGWNIQITLRDDDELELLDRFAKLTQVLEGWEVSPGGNGRKPASAPPPPTQEETTSDNGGGDLVQETETFAAQRLIGATSGDKTYWKLRGGIYTKYGVTIWPETLEAAGLHNLEPRQEYDLTGYSATVSLEGGKPKKVIKLERGK